MSNKKAVKYKDRKKMKRKKNETTLNRAPLDKPDAERQESYCLKEHDLFMTGSLMIRAS